MEKRIKKHWLEYYAYPSDFFESIGEALTVLGNLYTFNFIGILKSHSNKKASRTKK
jgi:hypothetical protein